MTYVDGFVLPVPKNNIDKYKEVATHAGAIWLEHGALSYKECVLEDNNSHGMVDFDKSEHVQEGETVVFAYIVYKSREHRDEVNAKVMADPRMNMENCKDIFDYKRMAYGGFKTLVEYGA